jgi:HlyD family secretion protein
MRVITLYLVVAALVGCGKTPPSPNGAAKSSATPITIVSPEKGVIRRVIEQPGTIQPDEETQLIAKVPGYVHRVAADIGQRVKGPKIDTRGREVELGQLLAELAVPEVVAEATQKQALVNQAEAEVEQGRKGVIAATATVATAEALVEEAKAGLAKAQANVDRWQSESNRVTGLVSSGVIDAQTRDETMNQLKAAEGTMAETKARATSAEAAVRKARADHGKAEADVKALQAKVEVSRAEVSRVEALLSYCKIRAPYDGVVTTRKVNTGDYVGTSGERAWLFTVARLDPVRVVIAIPEADAGLIEEKMPVELKIPSLRQPVAKGTIARTSWSLQPGSRTLRTEIDLANPDGRFRPGQFATARISVELAAEWTVPLAAVTKSGDASYCYLAQDGKAVRVAVQTGRSDGQRIELLKLRRGASADWSDFAASDRIASPAAGLVNGQNVGP